MTDRTKTALVTGGAKRIGARDRRGSGGKRLCRGDPLQPLGRRSRSARRGDRARRRQGDRGRGRPHRHGRGRDACSTAPQPRSGRSACWSTTPRSSRTIRATDFDSTCWDRHFAIHVKAPVLLAGKLAAGAAGRRRRAGRQHHRPARLEADAALFLLHAVEVGAVDGDADAGAGAGAEGARQRHRPGTDAAERAAGRRPISRRRSTGCS